MSERKSEGKKKRSQKIRETLEITGFHNFRNTTERTEKKGTQESRKKMIKINQEETREKRSRDYKNKVRHILYIFLRIYNFSCKCT
jgi:hypothetical protein